MTSNIFLVQYTWYLHVLLDIGLYSYEYHVHYLGVHEDPASL